MVKDGKIIQEELVALKNRMEEQLAKTEERIRDTGNALSRSRTALVRADDIVRATRISAENYDARAALRRARRRK
jgi:ElaB/YqjD/DUF883 family membrane-anchored ribosome-binding protein